MMEEAEFERAKVRGWWWWCVGGDCTVVRAGQRVSGAAAHDGGGKV